MNLFRHFMNNIFFSLFLFPFCSFFFFFCIWYNMKRKKKRKKNRSLFRLWIKYCYYTYRSFVATNITTTTSRREWNSKCLSTLYRITLHKCITLDVCHRNLIFPTSRNIFSSSIFFFYRFNIFFLSSFFTSNFSHYFYHSHT